MVKWDAMHTIAGLAGLDCVALASTYFFNTNEHAVVETQNEHPQIEFGKLVDTYR